MIEHKQMEDLSALVDGELAELPARRLADRLVEDDDIRERWGRYHLIGAVMREEYQADAGLAGQVKAALATEDDNLALVPKKSTRSLKPIAGFAVAASVAALALVSFRLFTAVEEPVTAPVAEIAKASASGTGNILPASEPVAVGMGNLDALSRRPRASSPQVRLVDGGQHSNRRPLSELPELEPETKARLNRYLLDHARTTRSGMRAMFPYAALVGYEER